MATVQDHHQQTRILVQAAAQVCEEKKGEETRILELDPIDSGLSDFFLVTSASNDRQAIAIADEIEHRLKKEFGIFPNSVEGRRKGEWILLDYVDFVVHVFLTERRAFYDIERLRKSARPFSPAEFDAELKAALAKKTVAARKKASAKAKPAAAKAAPVTRKTAAKKAPAKKAVARPAAKKAAAKAKPLAAKAKPVAKKVAAKTRAAVKPASAPKPNKAAKKSIAVKKPAVKTAAVTKSAVKKSAVKKAGAAKPAAARKAPVKKPVAKKTARKNS
jgi:ribosome-associated protein